MVRRIDTEEEQADVLNAVLLRQLLRQGDREEALLLAAEALRDGDSGPEFIAALIEVLEAPPRSRGRPRQVFVDWLGIWGDYRDLRSQGHTYEVAIEALADEYGKSGRSIETLVALGNRRFDAMKREGIEQIREMIESGEVKHGKTKEASQSVAAAVLHSFRCEYQTQRAEADGWVNAAGEPIQFVSMGTSRVEFEELRASCPHSCKEGCKRNQLIEGRRKCPLYWP